MKENREVTDTNVGDIEEAVKTMEHWVEYEKNNKDKINKADELINIQETILLEYKKILKENQTLKNFVSGIFNENIEKDFIPVQRVKDKIEELDIKISECEYSDDDDEEYKKAVEKDKLFLLNQKRVLQELLEKRK